MSNRSRPSATSLPPSPHDDEGARLRRYLVTMGIRVVCFILMVAIQPYGWHTLVFGVGAIFLPYIAVVLANVGQDAHETTAERPELGLPQAPAQPAEPVADDRVIRISESPPAVPAPPSPPASPAATPSDPGQGRS